MNKMEQLRGKSLIDTHPDIVRKYWDFDRNVIQPEEVTYGSKLLLCWKCKEGHSWKAILQKITTKGIECPYCCNKKIWVGYNDLATTHSELVKEYWDFTKNVIVPENVKYNSNLNVYFKCKKGHSFNRPINKMITYNSCPCCTKEEHTWSDDEDSIVRQYYGKLSNNVIKDTYLPNKTESSIKNRARILGIQKSRLWTEKEISIIREYYDKLTVVEIHQKYLSDRTLSSVRHKVKKMGLNTLILWSATEDKILKEYYYKLSVKELQERYLPNRTLESIAYRSEVLGLHSKIIKWTNEEDSIIRKYYLDLTDKEIHERYLPNRAIQSIKARRGTLGLRKNKRILV